MNQGSTEHYADDEIDLFELWNNIWEQKWLIAVVTFATTAVGLSYALMSTPVYKSEIYFLPPLQQDVQALNMQNMQNMQVYTIDQVYSDFLRNLQSRSLQKQFYEAKDLRSLYSNGEQVKSEHELFTNQFHKKMVLNKPNKKGDQTFVSLSFELKNNSELAASLLNEYVTFVFDQTRRQLINDVMNNVKSQAQNAKDQIKSKRALAKQRREDRIAELQEAIVIARAAGIERIAINEAANSLNMEYMRGPKALKAEVEVLMNRKSDDPFIKGIRNLQEKIALLQNTSIDANDIKVARIDLSAETPLKPIKPKKTLIVAVAMVLGLMLGVFIALIRSAVRNRQLQKSETATV